MGIHVIKLPDVGEGVAEAEFVEIHVKPGDVIQADGGTRTASISGGFVALYDAIQHLLDKEKIASNPIDHFVAAVSVGVFNNAPVLDLDYAEDCSAETDMNLVMNDELAFIEIQGTAEKQSFTQIELTEMLELGKKGISEIIQKQKEEDK